MKFAVEHILVQQGINYIFHPASNSFTFEYPYLEMNLPCTIVCGNDTYYTFIVLPFEIAEDLTTDDAKLVSFNRRSFVVSSSQIARRCLSPIHFLNIFKDDIRVYFEGGSNNEA